MNDTLLSQFERAAETDFGVRFVDGRERATFLGYRELWSRAGRMASWLQNRGVRPGDRVALIISTRREFFDAFYGAMMCGAVPVPMYPPIRLGRLMEYHRRTARMLNACSAQVLISEKRVFRLLRPTLHRYQPPLGAYAAESMRYLSLDPADSRELEPDALSFIQYSSGTTEHPKPIRLSHRQVLSNVDAISQHIENVYPEDAGFIHSGCSWLPLYHDMGLVGSVFVAIARPRDLTLIPPEEFLANPAIWLRTVSRFGATISPAPNFAYSMCVDKIREQDVQGIDLSRWLVALNGAEPVAPRVLKRFVKRFSRFGFPPHSLTPVYGLGEAGLAVTFSSLLESSDGQRFDRAALAERGLAQPTDADGIELVSVGPALPGFSIEIRDDKGACLPEMNLGRVCVRGPSIMQGYDGLAEETSVVRQGEWLDTGDRGFLCGNELFLFGRNKEIIIINGRNYSPNDIERMLDGRAGVRPGCHAAIGAVTEAGEQLTVLVETPVSSPLARRRIAERIQRAIKEGCGLSCHAELLDPGTLPRTSSGKIRRVEARMRFETGTLQTSRSLNPLNLIGGIVYSLGIHRSSQTDG